MCVTSLEMIDKAHAIASRPDVIFVPLATCCGCPVPRAICSFSIVTAVPDVRVGFIRRSTVSRSPGRIPQRSVSEQSRLNDGTRQCHGCLAGQQAGIQELFHSCVVPCLVPPAMASILQSSLNRRSGILGHRHVARVMGYSEYEPIAERFGVPIVITGFEPIDILQGVLMTVDNWRRAWRGGAYQYPACRAEREGNRVARGSR